MKPAIIAVLISAAVLSLATGHWKKLLEQEAARVMPSPSVVRMVYDSLPEKVKEGLKSETDSFNFVDSGDNCRGLLRL